jgi:glycosyltransferase involved in cell wall biosynthesis
MAPTLITIIAPCYNESVFAVKFLESLEQELSGLPYFFCVAVVNDHSTDNTLALLKGFRFKASNMRLDVVDLKFNVGHQGAIYQGFLYAQTTNCDHFIVMDSDGEDSPAAIPGLLQHLDADIVNVVRSRRKETFAFRMFYWFYKLLFRFVTGRQMNFGNFCLISRNVMESAVFTTFSHFAAFLSKQRCDTRYIVADRESRLGGQSKMSFKKLFYHGFKSFVAYGEDMLMIFFKGFIIIMAVLVLAVGNVIYQKFIAHTAILGWTSLVIIGLVNLAVICIGFFVLGLLLIHLNNQNSNSKEPIYEICTGKPVTETL